MIHHLEAAERRRCQQPRGQEWEPNFASPLLYDWSRHTSLLNLVILPAGEIGVSPPPMTQDVMGSARLQIQLSISELQGLGGSFPGIELQRTQMCIEAEDRLKRDVVNIFPQMQDHLRGQEADLAFVSPRETDFSSVQIERKMVQ